jgi:hypothetical protein
MRIVLALALTMTFATLPATAEGHTLSMSTAKAKTRSFIKAFYNEYKAIGATDYSSGPCFRKNKHRVHCDVSITVNDDFCEDQVAVYFTSNKSRKIKTKLLGSRLATCGL